MLSKLFSAAVLGIDAYLVHVETHLENQLPAIAIVGLPDGAVRESKERIHAAIKNSGIRFPNKRIVINLAPADIRKGGSAFDFPMAIGILAAIGVVPAANMDDCIFFGELSLDGSLQATRGILPVALAARRDGKRRLFLPPESAREAAIVDGVQSYGIATLSDAIEVLNGLRTLPPAHVDTSAIFSRSKRYAIDFCDVKGQEHVKRALEVAAAGGHNLVMIGPPGSGKTMLARCFATILPDMSLDEALETTKIHSVAGRLPKRAPLLATRPFRSPHHTISDAGLIGGGKVPRPGEVSLAHNGVLFLDELPEFKKHVLEVMRQPLEDGRVTIARASLSLSYPANFMLISAMNPCPCGYRTHAEHECSCPSQAIYKYLNRISGPLFDRIDIQVEVPAVDYEALASRELGEASAVIRERVERARRLQLERNAGSPGVYCNAHMGPQELRAHCRVDGDGETLLKTAMRRLGLSARAWDRILKVSRTIADLRGRPAIAADHIAEAIQYRSLDRQFSGG